MIDGLVIINSNMHVLQQADVSRLDTKRFSLTKEREQKEGMSAAYIQEKRTITNTMYVRMYSSIVPNRWYLGGKVIHPANGPRPSSLICLLLLRTLSTKKEVICSAPPLPLSASISRRVGMRLLGERNSALNWWRKLME